MNTREDAQTLILNIDAVEQLHTRLLGEGLDMRAEDGRIDTMETALVRSAGRVIALFGGAAAYARFRTGKNRYPNDTFWGLDAIVAQRNAQTLRRLASVIALIVCIAALGYVFRAKLFPPNPVGDATSAAEQAVRTNNLASAAKSISVGLLITPTNTTLLTWQATLSASLGLTESAQSTFGVLEKQMGTSNFLIERGQVYLRLNEAEHAVLDFTKVISLQPEMADLYYLRASAYEERRESRSTDVERRQDLTAALNDLQTCANLAEQQHSDVMLASAKLRIGMLMQNVQ